MTRVECAPIAVGPRTGDPAALQSERHQIEQKRASRTADGG